MQAISLLINFTVIYLRKQFSNGGRHHNPVIAARRSRVRAPLWALAEIDGLYGPERTSAATFVTFF